MVLLGAITLFMAARHPHFDEVPNVVVLQLIVTGFCFGVGIALFVVMMRAKKNPS